MLRTMHGDHRHATDAGHDRSDAPSHTPPIRAVVVDDEPLARQRLRHLLQQAGDIQIVGEGSTGYDAIRLIETVAPNLMFLDIQMPDLDGLAALARVPAESRPQVIFVTAHDEYAPQAFEVEALDYLLKPFSVERFREALQRARRRLAADQAEGPQIASLMSLLRTGPPRQQRLVVKSPEQVTFIKYEDIDWIESAGNYARVHVGTDAHLMRETMKNLESRLDNRFIRVHRATIVNSDRIKLISVDGDGAPWVVLRDGTRLSAGRYIESRLRKWMENKG
jgi:two-component system LytT family response regulator